MHEENNNSNSEETKLPQESKKSEGGDGVFKAGLILFIILIAAFLFGKPMNENEHNEHFKSDGFPSSPSSLFTQSGNSNMENNG